MKALSSPEKILAMLRGGVPYANVRSRVAWINITKRIYQTGNTKYSYEIRFDFPLTASISGALDIDGNPTSATLTYDNSIYPRWVEWTVEGEDRNNIFDFAERILKDWKEAERCTDTPKNWRRNHC